MKAVESTESVRLRQIARVPPYRRRDFESQKVRPVSLQVSFGEVVLLGGETPLAAETG